MKPKFILLALFATLSVAVAQGDDAKSLEQFEKSFEQGGPVEAANFVPAPMMKGRLHTVRALADNDGLVNTYFIESPEGVVEVTGTHALILGGWVGLKSLSYQRLSARSLRISRRFCRPS